VDGVTTVFYIAQCPILCLVRFINIIIKYIDMVYVCIDAILIFPRLGINELQVELLNELLLFY
jgi:hypothetical protein